MAAERTEVGVVVERRALKSRWADDVWQPTAVLPSAPRLEPGTALDPEGRLLYAGTSTIELLSALTAFYRDNLGSEAPVVWIAIAPDRDNGLARIVASSVDPDEGEALTADANLIVEAVPMPVEIRDWVGAFSARFPAPRLFTKHKRSRTEDT